MKHLLAFCLLIPWLVWSQSGSRADDPCRAAALQTIPRAQGTHVDPSGRTIEVTDKCLLVDGRPVVPVMGEVHYSRIPADEWADVLRTMKEGGVSIVATYVFWNHHEWTRGAYDFSGDRDLSRFLAEVKKAGLWAVVRLGPWAHGEAREGGFPDWLIDEAVAQAGGNAKKMRSLLRAKNPWFLGETEKFWTRLLPEVEPHFWKHGGPVVAVQLENESRGPWPYYQALKELAVKVGYDVPFYTRTGWPRLNGPETTFGEMIPLYGDYAEGFWDRELTSMPGAYKDAFVMRRASATSIATASSPRLTTGQSRRRVRRRLTASGRSTGRIRATTATVGLPKSASSATSGPSARSASAASPKRRSSARSRMFAV